MADQLENAFNIKSLKEECQDGDLTEEKVHISETAIIIDNAGLQDPLIRNKVEKNDISANLDYIKTEQSSLEVQYDILHDNLKLEKGISADDIKIEFNNGLLYCEDCHEFCEDYCAECEMLVYILNKTVLVNTDDTSQAELPNNTLAIQNYFGEFHVFTSKVIPAGVKFGPFTGINATECAWKIKGGKFVTNEDKSKYLNWMQYINPARNIYEQNLFAFQYEQKLYYRSTRQIQKGEELLVYFGEEYDDSLNRNVEMDFIPTAEYIFKDAFACTFCCLGFSSKFYLAKHKAICPRNADRKFSIEELMQCPSCKIHLDQKELFMHHMPYCCDGNDRKCILPTTDNRSTQGNGPKTRPCQVYKCQQCKYRTKYKGDLKKHTNHHYEVKMYKCGSCCRRFKAKEGLRLHVENTHIRADGKDHLELSTGVYVKAEYSCAQNEMKQFKCLYCEFQTSYKNSLKIHTKVKHLKEFNHKCEACDYKTYRKSDLNAHIETKHLKVFKYKCDSCDYKTNCNSHLKKHVKGKHLKEFNYKCDLCDYRANLKSNLTRHIDARHLDAFKYKCDTCDYQTNRKEAFKAHIQTRHLREFKYTCGACDYRTNNKTCLNRHVETKHLNVFKYKCDRCDYKTNIKGHLTRHKASTHSKVFNYTCDSCDYRVNSKTHLKCHIDTEHSKVFKYKCDSCDYKTNLKFLLKKHTEVRHVKEFKYKCATCDYKAKQKHQLQRHTAARHLEEFKHKCDTCHYKTNQEHQLRRHIRARHLKEYKHKCDMCDFKTNRKASLQIHVESKHLKEFKYKCDRCDYKSNQKLHLNEHVQRTHLKVFKYECDACDYKAIRKFHMQRHIEIRHLKEFKYKCDRCEYKANQKHHLQRHMKAKHPKEFNMATRAIIKHILN